MHTNNNETWEYKEKNFNSLQKLVHAILVLDLAIIVIQLLVPTMRIGLLLTFIPLAVYLFPIILIGLSNTETNLRLFCAYFIHQVHITVLFFVLVSFLIIFILSPKGALFMGMFGGAGLLGVALSSYGLGLVYLLQGLVFTFYIPVVLYPMIKTNSKNIYTKFATPYKHLPVSQRAVFMFFWFIYAGTCIFIYTLNVMWMIPTDSQFWKWWMFN